MLKTPQKCDSFAALFGQPSHLGLSLNLHFDQKNAFLGQCRTRRPDVCLELVSLSSPHGRVSDGPDTGSAFFKRGPIKVGNTHVDFIQKAFERARARYARVAGLGHPARCASSGMYGEVLTASPAGSAPHDAVSAARMGDKAKPPVLRIYRRLSCVRRRGRPASRANSGLRRSQTLKCGHTLGLSVA